MGQESIKKLIPEPVAGDVAKELFNHLGGEETFIGALKLAFKGSLVETGLDEGSYKQTTWTDGDVYDGLGRFTYQYTANLGATDVGIFVDLPESPGVEGLIPRRLLFLNHTSVEGKSTDSIVLEVLDPENYMHGPHSAVFTRDNATGKVLFRTNLLEHQRGGALRFLYDGEVFPQIMNHIKADIANA